MASALIHHLQQSSKYASLPHVLGIDEAGRGPVIGPMVYAAAYCPIEKSDELKTIKVADSKTLTHEQRTDRLSVLHSTDWIGTVTDVIHASHLSALMQQNARSSLNKISHDSAISLVQAALDKNINVQCVYVDTVGDANSYRKLLESAFPNIEFTVTPKADALFPIVSAASIVAKVTRDAEVQQWEFKENGIINNLYVQLSNVVGSGYPSDPSTKKWMKHSVEIVFGYPNAVRFSWATTRLILKEKCVPMKWYDQLDDIDTGNTQKVDHKARKVSEFFAPNVTSSVATNILSNQRAPYFRRHGMELTQSFGASGSS